MNKLNFTLILQARLKSTRFPQKVLKKLGKDEIVIFLQKRLSSLSNLIKFNILAVPKTEEDIFKKYCIDCFYLSSGSEENVLSRFADSFYKYESDYLIRVTCDNPFTSLIVLKENIEILNEILNKNEKLPDYFIRENLPLGTQTEIIKKEAFWNNFNNANKSYHFEHVTPYIYENPDRFLILKKPFIGYEDISKLRLTIDTKKDYLVVKNIITHFNEKNKSLYFIDIDDIKNLYYENKKEFEINLNEIQKNYKE